MNQKYEIRRRHPFVAFLLTLLASGLGQMYNGQLAKGVFFLFLPWIGMLLALLILDGISVDYIGMLPVLFFLGAYIYIFVDAIRMAQKSGYVYRLKAYNKWYLYILFLVISLVLTNYVLKPNLAETFRMPSGSMEPTLVTGDFLIADKTYYLFREPARGDIIVFKYPKDETKIWLKRILGLPGEEIGMKNGQVYINGEPFTDTYFVTDETADPAGKKRDYGPVVLPENKFFVLGDNLDHSYDSRYWGFVDRKKIKGKARAVYWSWDRDSFRVRWHRLGDKISYVTGTNSIPCFHCKT